VHRRTRTRARTWSSSSRKKKKWKNKGVVNGVKFKLEELVAKRAQAKAAGAPE